MLMSSALTASTLTEMLRTGLTRTPTGQDVFAMLVEELSSSTANTASTFTRARCMRIVNGEPCGKPAKNSIVMTPRNFWVCREHWDWLQFDDNRHNLSFEECVTGVLDPRKQERMARRDADDVYNLCGWIETSTPKAHLFHSDMMEEGAGIWIPKSQIVSTEELEGANRYELGVKAWICEKNGWQ
jgi:hypothetical protein